MVHGLLSRRVHKCFRVVHISNLAFNSIILVIRVGKNNYGFGLLLGKFDFSDRWQRTKMLVREICRNRPAKFAFVTRQNDRFFFRRSGAHGSGRLTAAGPSLRRDGTWSQLLVRVCPPADTPGTFGGAPAHHFWRLLANFSSPPAGASVSRPAIPSGIPSTSGRTCSRGRLSWDGSNGFARA